MAAGTFVGLVASSLCLLMPPVAPGKTAKQTAPPAISWHTAGEIEVPFEYFKQHIYVPVSLNGKPGFTFMVDSGANTNILNLRTARQLGMEPGAVKQERNIGFGDAPIYVAPQESLNAEIDSISVADKVAVMDLTRLEQHFGHPADGMLGCPFFRRFVVKIDFERNLLHIFLTGRYRYRGWVIKLALKPDKNFVVIPIALGDGRKIHHNIDIAVDTGSDVTLMLYERFVPGLNLEDSLQNALPATAFGLNGFYQIALGSIDVFLIGDAEVQNVPVDYLSASGRVGPDRTLPGAIGMGVLRSFRAIIFDVPHQRMVFELKPPPLSTRPKRLSTD